MLLRQKVDKRAAVNTNAATKSTTVPNTTLTALSVPSVMPGITSKTVNASNQHKTSNLSSTFPTLVRADCLSLERGDIPIQITKVKAVIFPVTEVIVMTRDVILDIVQTTQKPL